MPPVKADTGLLLRRISRASRSEKWRENGIEAAAALCDEAHPVTIDEAVALISDRRELTFALFDVLADGFARWQASQLEKSL